MKAVVFTLGCKVNEYEGDTLIAELTDRGYTVSNKLEYADLYIVNTCAVTLEAEKKSRQMVSRIKKFNPNAKIIFTGCAVEKNPKPFLNKSDSYLLTGVFGKSKIPNLLDKCGEMIEPESAEYEDLHIIKTFRKRAFIKVQDGCNNFCSYCIIPYLRGRERSRNPEKIIEEISSLSPKETVITGINLSAYNYNGTDLTGLIKKLYVIKSRIRLGSLEVRVITREFLSALKGLYDFAPHFHLSLQSGSDSVLKKMNRKYNREEYLAKVNLIREYFPDCAITTDIIVGFPTETEKDFIDTLDLVDKVKFSDIHAFTYSPRSGTVAYKFKDISGDIKKDRLNRLLEKKADCKLRFIEKEKDKTLYFLPEETEEGFTVGYTENYIRVYVKDCKYNDICKIKLIEPFKDGAIAEIID